MLYALRTGSCHGHHLLTTYDRILREGLQEITNIDLSDSAWLQASLPIPLGGLGIRRATDLALPCFLSSMSSFGEAAADLVSSAVAHDQEFITSLSFFDNVPDNPGRQKSWDSINMLLRQKSLLENAQDDATRCRLLAASSPQSGAWLEALPSSPLGLKLTDEQLRIAVALRLGSPVCVPHNCQLCGTPVDVLGSHGLSCRYSSGRHSRHRAVNDVIKRALASADLPSTLEPAGASFCDGRRPDGLTHLPWKGGLPLAWDFTCVDSLAPSNIVACSSVPAAAAEKAYRAKEAKYIDLGSRFHVQPVAVETLGSWAVGSLAFVRDLGRRVAKTNREPRAGTFLFQSISMIVQKTNAASVLGTLPQSRTLEEIYSIL